MSCFWKAQDPRNDIHWGQGLSWPRQEWRIVSLSSVLMMEWYRGLFFLHIFHGKPPKVIVMDQPWVLASFMSASVIIRSEDWWLPQCFRYSWFRFMKPVIIGIQVLIWGAPASWWGWKRDDENHWHWDQTQSHGYYAGDVNYSEDDQELIRQRWRMGPDIITSSDSRDEPSRETEDKCE